MQVSQQYQKQNCASFNQIQQMSWLDWISQFMGFGSRQGQTEIYSSKFKRRQYSGPTARRTAFYAQIVYKDKKTISNFNFEQVHLKDLKLEDLYVYEQQKENVQTLIGFNKNYNEIVVAFRGTQPTSIKNWMRNKEALKVIWDYVPGTNKQVWVHQGFDASYDSVRELITNQLKSMTKKHERASVVVCGHSLGGAIANLFAVQATHLVPNEVIAYTFGQPRVGNEAFARLTDMRVKTYYRVIHDDDLVARIPNFNYYHSGREVIYDDTMKVFKICPPDSKELSSSLDRFDIISDHSMNQYIKIMQSKGTEIEKEGQLTISQKTILGDSIHRKMQELI